MKNIRIKKSKWFKQSQCKECKSPMDDDDFLKNKYVCPNCGYNPGCLYDATQSCIVRIIEVQKRYLFIWVTINKRIEYKDQ